MADCRYGFARLSHARFGLERRPSRAAVRMMKRRAKPAVGRRSSGCSMTRVVRSLSLSHSASLKRRPTKFKEFSRCPITFAASGCQVILADLVIFWCRGVLAPAGTALIEAG